MLSQRENVNFKSINHIKSIFDNVGLSYVWNQQNPIHLVEVKLIVKQKLTNQFIQKWYNLIATSFRGNYLLKLSPNERALITKLRCCNLKIPVEPGRWVNIPREERLVQVQVLYSLRHIYKCNKRNIIQNIVHIMTDITNIK